jgi:hypothetical protein
MEQQPEVLKHQAAVWFKKWHGQAVPIAVLFISHFLFQLPGFIPVVLCGGLSYFALIYYRRANP